MRDEEEETLGGWQRVASSGAGEQPQRDEESRKGGGCWVRERMLSGESEGWGGGTRRCDRGRLVAARQARAGDSTTLTKTEESRRGRRACCGPTAGVLD